MTISTSRASPSQARGEGEEQGAAAPRARGWCGYGVEMMVAAALRGERGAARVRVEGVAARWCGRGAWGGCLGWCRTPPFPEGCRAPPPPPRAVAPP